MISLGGAAGEGSDPCDLCSHMSEDASEAPLLAPAPSSCSHHIQATKGDHVWPTTSTPAPAAASAGAHLWRRYVSEKMCAWRVAHDLSRTSASSATSTAPDDGRSSTTPATTPATPAPTNGWRAAAASPAAATRHVRCVVCALLVRQRLGQKEKNERGERERGREIGEGGEEYLWW
jgi:hypothetical protein